MPKNQKDLFRLAHYNGFKSFIGGLLCELCTSDFVDLGEQLNIEVSQKRRFERVMDEMVNAVLDLPEDQAVKVMEKVAGKLEKY